MALYINLQKYYSIWGLVEKVLSKNGAPIKALETIYKVVVQAVLQYIGKKWVATDTMMTVLEVFHHRTARNISGMTERKGGGGEWEWASVDADL